LARRWQWSPLVQDKLDIWRQQFAGDVVGQSDALVSALDMVRRSAATDLSILITGETGTGKELFARAAHRGSNRRAKPFVAVNCAAIPEQLFEAELFGHARGAFTGAAGTRSGRFQSADGGTLFLDEIGDLPLAAQAKLLRVLEHGTVSPLGSDTEIQVDVRVIAATHRNLDEMVASGAFRADLYFRLAVVNVELPALRDRDGDFDLLLDGALASATRKTGYVIDGVDDDARAALRTHSWPGNVRELAHRIERAVVLAGGGVLKSAHLKLPTPARPASRPMPVLAVAPRGGRPAIPHHDLAEGTNPGMPMPLGAAPLSSERSLDLRSALEHLERRLIDEALHEAGGNRTVAAALLGLNRTTLAEKLRKHAG
jgi:transcriptional regulator with GAF, ATPase, and Fis domain